MSDKLTMYKFTDGLLAYVINDERRAALFLHPGETFVFYSEEPRCPTCGHQKPRQFAKLEERRLRCTSKWWQRRWTKEGM